MPFSVMGFPPHHCSPQRNRRGPVPPRRGFFFSSLRPRADEFRLRSSDLGTGVKTRPMSLARLDHPSPQAAGNLPACSVQPYRDARQDYDDVAALNFDVEVSSSAHRALGPARRQHALGNAA